MLFHIFFAVLFCICEMHSMCRGFFSVIAVFLSFTPNFIPMQRSMIAFSRCRAVALSRGKELLSRLQAGGMSFHFAPAKARKPFWFSGSRARSHASKRTPQCTLANASVFSLSGSRPITRKRTSFPPASRRNVVLFRVALLVAYVIISCFVQGCHLHKLCYPCNCYVDC